MGVESLLTNNLKKMKKEYNNSFSPAIAQTKGFDRNASMLAQKEFDRKANLARNTRHYCRNMNNRNEKLEYLKFFLKNIGTENVIMVSTSSHIPLSENRAVTLMGKFDGELNYVAVAEKAGKYHLHYIVQGESSAKYMERALRRLRAFKSKYAVHLLYGDRAVAEINYILKSKHNNLTHIDYYFKTLK